MVKYVSTYTKGTLKKRSVKGLSNDAYVMFLCFFFFLIFFLKAYVAGIHLNYIDLNGYPRHMALYRSRQKVHWR